MKKFFIILLIIPLFFTSCIKKRALKEAEDKKILTFIYDSGLDFDTTKSGAIYHITYNGIGNNNELYSIVPIIYSGFYINQSGNKIPFIENDTTSLQIGNSNLMKGWSEVLQKVGDGGAGIIIFPHNIAFKNDQTPNVPANSSLYFYFRLKSNNYSTAQNYEFFKYVEKYDSIVTIFDDSLAYVKYFDGLGPKINSAGYIDFIMSNTYDTIYFSSKNYLADFSNPNLTSGLIKGLSMMSEGEMGKIIVPPSLSYTEENNFGIAPYSTLVYEVRAIAAAPAIEEKSKIDKYLYLNNAKPDSILPNGIYYFVNTQSENAELPDAQLNANIYYSDSLYLLNETTPVQSCQNCNTILNSNNFDNFKIKCITTIKAGEEATFIIPYTEGYGTTGSQNIPPYATLLYKIKLDSIK